MGTPSIAGIAAYLAVYWMLAGLGVSIGYHRMLAHRSFKLARWLELTVLAIGLPAGTPVQWAGNHRRHHAFTDIEGDPHSPVLRGFWWGHCGWYIGTDNAWACLVYALAGPLRTALDAWHRPRTNQEWTHLARDISADPVLAWISRPWPYTLAVWTHLVVTTGLAVLCFGPWGLAVAWAASVLIYNLGDGVDSVGHLVGDQPWTTGGRARNHLVTALLTFGDGWHANHHAFPTSARHGFGAGQPDWSWGVLRLLAALGLAWDIRETQVGAEGG